MVILGILVGAVYGVLVSQMRRLSWPVRILVVVSGLTALVLAADRLVLSPDSARPWTAGMAAGALVLLGVNAYELTAQRRRRVRH